MNWWGCVETDHGCETDRRNDADIPTIVAMNWQVLQGDCLEVMAKMEAGSFDLVLTDPPAGIAFMNKEWDKDKGGRDKWIEWMAGVAKECLRLVKPGGSAVVWSIPRTSHWTATAWENGGWLVKDRLAHIFGSGFPKSLDISKAIDKAAGAERKVVAERRFGGRDGDSVTAGASNGGTQGGYNLKDNRDSTAPATPLAQLWQGYGTALKPAVEDWWWFMKPLDGTFAQNAERHGVAGVNVDGGRIPTKPGDYDHPGNSGIEDNTQVYGRFANKNQSSPAPAGRFPANLILGCACESDKHDPDCAAALLDEQSGVRPGMATQNDLRETPSAYFGAHKHPGRREGRNDSGGASRFFYCAKASRAEREAGLEGLPTTDNATAINQTRPVCNVCGCGTIVAGPGKTMACGHTDIHFEPSENDKQGNPRQVANHHPTVKPLALMRYLLRLFDTPTGGKVLDPFLGSGSTMVACVQLGRDCVGIEREPEYAEIARARIAAATRQGKLAL